jgi:ABC-type Na+ efflux pump permease subunit
MKKVVWDRLGIAFSSACVVHCIMVAFLPFFLPFISQYTHSSWIHFIVLFTMLFTTPFAFVPGYKKHGLTWILAMALIGLLMVILSVIIEGKVSDQLSHGISICGSLFLVFAHAKNIQHSHRHVQHPCC